MNPRPRFLDRLWALFPASWMLPVLVGLGFLAVGAAVTVVAAAEISNHMSDRRVESFEHEVDELTNEVEARVNAAAAILAGLDGLLVSGDVAARKRIWGVREVFGSRVSNGSRLNRVWAALSGRRPP